MDERLRIKITAEIADAKAKMQEVSGEIDNLENKESEHAEHSTKNWAIVGAAIAAAVAVVVKSVTEITNKVTEAYGQYEQLTGGVEKLFGESSGIVEEYAKGAYKTAQISANDYMSLATSFSASLLQSLGGDTKAAAEYANTAIMDMSDNANTFGTNIDSIQNAYQGFAKQNYTMLDNLKLGYGGTKKEMERLIEDANKLRVAHGKAATLTINSYADVVEAIHTVQTEMGITGTTAREASKTIEGSMNMAKASIDNLFTALGDGEADIQAVTREAISSVETYLSNLEALFGTIAEQIPEVIASIGDNSSGIMSIVTDIINDCIKIAGELIIGFIENLPEILANLPDIAKTLAETAVTIIIETLMNLPELIVGIFETVLNIVGGIFEGIGNAFARAFGGEKIVAAMDAREAIAKVAESAGHAQEEIEKMHEASTKQINSMNAEIAMLQDWKGRLDDCVDSQGRIIEGREGEAQAIAAQLEQQGIHVEIQGNEITNYGELNATIDEHIEKLRQETLAKVESGQATESIEQSINSARQAEEMWTEASEWRAKALIETDALTASLYWKNAEEAQAAGDKFASDANRYYGEYELHQNNLVKINEGNMDAICLSVEEAGIDINKNCEFINKAYNATAVQNQKTSDEILSNNKNWTAEDINTYKQYYTDLYNAQISGDEKAIAEAERRKNEFIQKQDETGMITLSIQQKANADLIAELEAARPGMSEAMQQNVDVIIAELKSPYENIKELGRKHYAETFANGISSYREDTRARGNELGLYVTSGFASGIRAGRSDVLNAMTDVCAQNMAVARAQLGIHSPSTVFRKFGQYIDEGLALGIEDGSKDVLSVMDNLSNELSDSFSPDISLGDTIDSINSIEGAALDTNFNLSSNYTSTLINANQEVVSAIYTLLEAFNNRDFSMNLDGEVLFNNMVERNNSAVLNTGMSPLMV